MLEDIRYFAPYGLFRFSLGHKIQKEHESVYK